MNAGDAAGGDGATQFGRALTELTIDILCANSQRAKGRVERVFGTLQNRLVKELRLVALRRSRPMRSRMTGLSGISCAAGG